MEDNLQVSFKDIFNQIIKLKFYLVAINIILITSTIFLIISNQTKWEGSLDIYLLNSINHNKYEQLERFSEIYSVDQEYLRLLLIEEIADREEVSEILSKLDILKMQDFPNESSFNFALRQASYSLEIVEPNPNIDNLFSIKFTHHNQDVIMKIFEYIISKSNLKVKDFLTGKYKNLVKNIELSNGYKIIDIDEKISFLEERKENFILNRLNFLHEQAQMARDLGIKNPTIDLTSMNADDGSKLTTLDKDQPFYFQGYVAIEKEIELLKLRDEKVNVFDSFYQGIISINQELDTLKMEKFTIESDFTLKRIGDAFDNSPLNSDTFIAVNYDLADIDYQKLNISNKIILLLGIALSIFISLVFILFRIISDQISQS